MPITGKGAAVPYEKSVKTIPTFKRLPGPCVTTAKGNGPPPKDTQARR